MADNEFRVNLEFQGFVIAILSDDRDTIELVKRDFRFFESANVTPNISIKVSSLKPDFTALPNLTATIYSKDYNCYRMFDELYTDYNGQALRVYRAQSKEYRIFTENRDLRHEICYLTVLAAAGRHLDSKHLHRVHSLGFKYRDHGVLVLLPQKGGKTTLALRIIKSGLGQILSEDSPLINRKGEVLPFPLRLGIVPGNHGEDDIPGEYRYVVNFMGVGDKILVDPEYYMDQIGTSCPVKIVLIGRKTLGVDSSIERCSKTTALKEFVENTVIGLGLHQGLEVFFGQGLWHTLGNTRLAFSRLYNSARVVANSRVYVYKIGHDIETNYRVLQDFLLRYG